LIILFLFRLLTITTVDVNSVELGLTIWALVI